MNKYLKKNDLGLSGLITLMLVSLACSQGKKVADPLPYLNHQLSEQVRVDDLLRRMTLEEKVSQLVYQSPAIPRLNIPEYNWWNEALHGVARAGLATVFPQAIGLAATWDTRLIFQVASIISDEARAKYHDALSRDKRGIYQGLTFWSPNINIFRDPRWGRGMETYGEDPILTGRLAVAFVKGLQGDHARYFKTIATPKHFAVHSGPEPDRHSFNAHVDDYDLHETYLPAFKMAVVEGGAYSVMCAYNRFRDQACCASPLLIEQILRKEWGFKGYVVSDCWAISDIYKFHKIVESGAAASAMAIRIGTDLNCGNSYPKLIDAVRLGLITENEINTSVKRLLLARFKLGMFDPCERNPYSQIPISVLDSPEHRQMALQAARKSIVLLKNEPVYPGDNHKALPLKKEIKKLALIGPNSDDIDVLLANYNGFPANPITVAQGIRQKLGSKTTILQAQGCALAEGIPSFEVIPGSVLFTSNDKNKKPGLRGEYYDNRDFKGGPILTRVDEKVDFNWWNQAPVKGMDDDNFAVRWQGFLIPEKTGQYALGAYGFNGYKVYLQDKLIAQVDAEHNITQKYKYVELKAGHAYKIKLEFFEKSRNALIQLIWSYQDTNLEQKALSAAKAADAVVMVMGLSPLLEGEEMPVSVKGFKGGDRLHLQLPDPQQRLIKKVVDQNKEKPVVLVLLNGSALSLHWESQHVPAIVEAWYPGQAGGAAIADVLFGDYNPGGRLPVTFYASVNQLPPFSDYNMEGRTYRYFRGKPVYCFGHGLSYTVFDYGLPSLKNPVIGLDESTELMVTVTNSGKIAGEEVVQLYIKKISLAEKGPIKTLKSFQRIFLEAGQSHEVCMKISAEMLSCYDPDLAQVAAKPGIYAIMVGSSSREEDLQKVEITFRSET